MVRYSELFETVNTSHIETLLSKHFVIEGQVTIDNNGFVSTTKLCKFVDKDRQYNKLPVKFATAERFHCWGNCLISLEGAPTSTSDDFSCHANQITSLIGCPTTIGGSFMCSRNQLQTLEGAPKSVGRTFYCSENNLLSLNGFPDSFTRTVSVTYNPKLGLLRLLKCKTILFDSESPIGDFEQDNSLIDAEEAVYSILTKYKGNGSRRNILACQKELIQSGFEGNASW